MQVNIQTSSILLHNGRHSISPQTQWQELQACGLVAASARVASRHGCVQKTKMLLRLQTQLREELQARGLDAAGGKPALVERLHSALASRPAAGVSAQRAGATADRPAAANKELLRLRERVRSFWASKSLSATRICATAVYSGRACMRILLADNWQAIGGAMTAIWKALDRLRQVLRARTHSHPVAGQVAALDEELGAVQAALEVANSVRESER